MTSIHNIRRPAFALVLMCVVAAAFLVLTEPRVGLVRYAEMGPVDELRVGWVGTVSGLVGVGLVLAVAVFLCTRKGTPPKANPGGSGGRRLIGA